MVKISILISLLFAQAEPIQDLIFSVKKTSELSSLDVELAQRVIHETENHWILRSPVLDMDVEDYYYLQLSPRIKNLDWLKGRGRILDFKEGEFAIFKPFSKDDLLRVAHELHERSGQCGAVQKLSSDPFVSFDNQVVPVLFGRQDLVEELISEVSTQRILSGIETMVSWGTRFEGSPIGEIAGEKLRDLYQPLIPVDRGDVSLELVSHRGTAQNSLIVRIEGRTEPNKVVILGSHLDSINRRDRDNAPGADDNASGTMTNFEIFRQMMLKNFRPERTIEIHAYAAEEIGLVGSGEIARSYRDKKVEVISMLQFDMNGYSANGKSEIFFVSNGTNRDLTDQLGGLVDLYLKVPWSKKRLNFGSSDHAAWHKRGFPVAFPTENPRAFNRKIHTSDDNLQVLNQPEQMAIFAKLGLAYFVHFSGGQIGFD